MATSSVFSSILQCWSFLLFLSDSQLNQWGDSTGSNGEDIWYSTSDFVPVHAQSFGTIRIGRIMSVEFDFIFGGRTNDPNENQTEMFFRIGYDAAGGTSCHAQNSRYPSLWLSNSANTLFLVSSDGSGCSNVHLLDSYGSIMIGTVQGNTYMYILLMSSHRN